MVNQVMCPVCGGLNAADIPQCSSCGTRFTPAGSDASDNAAGESSSGGGFGIAPGPSLPAAYAATPVPPSTPPYVAAAELTAPAAAPLPAAPIQPLHGGPGPTPVTPPMFEMPLPSTNQWATLPSSSAAPAQPPSTPSAAPAGPYDQPPAHSGDAPHGAPDPRQYAPDYVDGQPLSFAATSSPAPAGAPLAYGQTRPTAQPESNTSGVPTLDDFFSPIEQPPAAARRQLEPPPIGLAAAAAMGAPPGEVPDRAPSAPAGPGWSVRPQGVESSPLLAMPEPVRPQDTPLHGLAQHPGATQGAYPAPPPWAQPYGRPPGRARNRGVFLRLFVVLLAVAIAVVAAVLVVGAKSHHLTVSSMLVGQPQITGTAVDDTVRSMKTGVASSFGNNQVNDVEAAAYGPAGSPTLFVVAIQGRIPVESHTQLASDVNKTTDPSVVLDPASEKFIDRNGVTYFCVSSTISAQAVQLCGWEEHDTFGVSVLIGKDPALAMTDVQAAHDAWVH